ncbi:MAG: CidA/LrgA family protein [Actinomycetota bacterium]|nr:CidA/LrgA family protein [Actinomycetota bacterium]
MVLLGLVAVLLCQLLGEVLVRLTNAPVPGPVVGMVVFLLVLRVRRPSEDHALVRAPAVLLRHLQLWFVPPGVGVIVFLDKLLRDAVPLAAGLWLSWLAGIVVTGWVVTALLRRTPGAGDR